MRPSPHGMRQRPESEAANRFIPIWRSTPDWRCDWFFASVCARSREPSDRSRIFSASTSEFRITRRSAAGGDSLALLTKPVERGESLHLLIDSSGLKMYGAGEWLEEKHGERPRRHWRKLHLAIDATTQEIVAVELTSYDVGDITALPDLLDQIEDPAASVVGDGAYDADMVYDGVCRHFPEADVIIPPRLAAVVSEDGTTRRDAHLRTIEKHGRVGWQRRSGYCRRSLVETAMFRYKTIIGRRLHARTLSNQKTEARIGCDVLNRMTNLGMPISVCIK
jgi:hypothetical protein